MIKNEAGRSMMEMMGVLSIIGILSAGGLAGINKLFAQHKVNKSVEQISVMSAKLSQIGAQTGSYEGLDVASAIKFGAVPSSAIDSLEENKLANPFGGNIKIEPANLISGESDNQGYTITYDGLPEDACMSLITQKWGSRGGASLVAVAAVPSNTIITINSVKSVMGQNCNGEANTQHVVGCAEADEDGIGIPIDPVSAINACNCPNGTCSIVWMYF